MSQPVDIERIRKFKEDRMSLPYDDTVIAKRMKVDRSNYSKAVNAGPITNAFLRKFYVAFGDELGKTLKAGGSVDKEKEELVKRLETLEQLLVQLVETNILITRQAEQLVENTALLVRASQARKLSGAGRKDGEANNS